MDNATAIFIALLDIRKLLPLSFLFGSKAPF
jgi:hypothetical protein